MTVTVTSNDVGYIRFSGYWADIDYSDSGNIFASANTKATLTYTPSDDETITNWIRKVGYESGKRMSLTQGTETTSNAAEYELTGYIPVKRNDVIRIKNIDITNESATNIVGFNSSKQAINGSTTTYGTALYYAFVEKGTETNGVYKTTLNSDLHNCFSDSDLAYIRIGSKSITDDSIVTVNEEIV